MKALFSERAQAVAADLLFLGTLISISSAMIFVFGLGARQADMHAAALRQRYVGEVVQSVLLASRYTGEDCGMLEGSNYSLALVGAGDFVSSALPDLRELPLEGGPFERKVCGSIFDLIADDIVFSSGSESGGTELTQNVLVGSGYHSAVEGFIEERFNMLAPGIGYYMTARYPSDRESTKSALMHLELNYNNTDEVPSGEVYSETFYILLEAPGCAENEEAPPIASLEVKAWYSGAGGGGI